MRPTDRTGIHTTVANRMQLFRPSLKLGTANLCDKNFKEQQLFQRRVARIPYEDGYMAAVREQYAMFFRTKIILKLYY